MAFKDSLDSFQTIINHFQLIFEAKYVVEDFPILSFIR